MSQMKQLVEDHFASVPQEHLSPNARRPSVGRGKPQKKVKPMGDDCCTVFCLHIHHGILCYSIQISLQFRFRFVISGLWVPNGPRRVGLPIMLFLLVGWFDAAVLISALEREIVPTWDQGRSWQVGSAGYWRAGRANYRVQIVRRQFEVPPNRISRYYTCHNIFTNFSYSRFIDSHW